jgi:LPXTG-motif cell wall-anchored protein
MHMVSKLILAAALIGVSASANADGAAAPAGPASPTAAPEIDPTSAASGLVLLVGGLLVLRGRKQKIDAA